MYNQSTMVFKQIRTLSGKKDIPNIHEKRVHLQGKVLNGLEHIFFI